MRRTFIPGIIIAILIFGGVSDLLAAGIGFVIKTSVATPSLAEMKIIPWVTSGSTISSKIINFNTGATGTALPGRNSYLDSPDDGWTAKDENVGFDLLCVGPPSSKLYVSCGELSDGLGHVIHHKDTYSLNGLSYTRKNFGVTITRDFGSPPTSVYDDALRTGPVGAGTLVDTFSPTDYSHMYHFYNWLNLPAETVPGNYSSNNYVITFI